MEAYLVGFIGTPVYLGWFWLLLAAATFIGALLLRTVPSASALGPIRMVLLATSASVCLYILPYFFVAPSSDFRYLYWPVVATHVQIAVLVGIVVQPRTWQKRRQEDPQAFLSSSQMD